MILTNGGLRVGAHVRHQGDDQRSSTTSSAGAATTLQGGSSGLVFDPGTISGAGSFTWYGGAALTTGRLDPKTLLYTDVESQHTVGLEGDVCDMLVSGLKTRH